MIRSIMFDITKRKKAEGVFFELEQRFKLIVENIEEAFWMADVELQKMLYISPGYEKIWGRTSNSLYENPKFSLDAIHPEYCERVLADLRSRNPEKAFDFKYRIIRPDGSIRWIWDRGFPVRSDSGQVMYYVGIAQDITEHNRMEEAIHLSGERYRTIIDEIEDGYYEMDLAGSFTFVNDSMTRILGYSRKELIGMNYRLFTPVEEVKGTHEIFNKVHQTGEPLKWVPFTNIRKDGTLIFVEDSISTLRSKEGKIIGFRGISREITGQKKGEEEPKQSLDKVHRTMGGVIQAMALTIETRDPYTAIHQRRVADLARSIGQEMGLTKDQVATIHMAGMVHDLGMISIPLEILSNPAQLSSLEFGLIRVHPQIGYKILKDIDFPWPIAKIVYQHHERINGSGYPVGLKDGEILPEAKVLMVADVVEAIASHRPYRPAQGIDVAMKKISMNGGIIYDPEVVNTCLRLFKDKGFKLK